MLQFLDWEVAICMGGGVTIHCVIWPRISLQEGTQWSMSAVSLFFGPKDLVKTAIAFTRIHQSTYRFEILTLLIKDSYK